MVTELNEYVSALQDLRKAVQDMHREALDTRDKMAKAMNDSHIPSALTAFDNAFSFRKTMDLIHPTGRHTNFS